MPAQVQSDVATIAWRRFLRAHCAISRVLDQELRAAHGLTINDFDVLMRLREAEHHRMRMSDLAKHVVLTRSGMTRLIDGLVDEGLVERVSCSADARVSYAQITPAGLERANEAMQAHQRGIERVFTSHYSDAELTQLNELLGKLPAADKGIGGCDCAD